MTRTEAINQVREILTGIDRCEDENESGCWETTAGAEFGAKKLAEVEALIRSLE